ncbi:MAG: response regulator transcription factor [Ignavibacteria bacterium]|nr:MAG: response regulator transcription factor [Ignavibacteria bacterium]
MNPVIKVAIVEDDSSIGMGLMSYINSTEGLECTVLYPSGCEVIKKIKSNIPDIVLMDISMPEISGIECTEVLKSLYPNLTIIMLTVFDDDKKVFDSLKAGASGYILKRTPLEKIVELIKEAYMGGAPMSPSIARKVLNYFNKNNKIKTEYNLSKREKEILGELVKGYTYKKISENLFISLDTVRSHIKNIYVKLHVNSKSQAVIKALRDNLL